MAQGTGQAELIEAMRSVQMGVPELSAAGIYLATPTRQDPLPAWVNSVYKPGVGRKSLLGTDRQRVIVMACKAVASERDGVDGFEIAQALATLNFELWQGKAGQERLNAVLEPLGFGSAVPLERGDIGPYKDMLDDLERWHVGHLFGFTLKRL